MAAKHENQTHKHLTNDELAQRYGVHKMTPANWRVKGTGPKYIKVGKLVFYPIKEVEDWEQDQLRSSTAE